MTLVTRRRDATHAEPLGTAVPAGTPPRSRLPLRRNENLHPVIADCLSRLKLHFFNAKKARCGGLSQALSTPLVLLTEPWVGILVIAGFGLLARRFSRRASRIQGQRAWSSAFRWRVTKSYSLPVRPGNPQFETLGGKTAVRIEKPDAAPHRYS